MMQIKLDSGVVIDISQEAFDVVASNAYKFPKPKDVPATIAVTEMVDGKEVVKHLPNIKLCQSLDYIYAQCMATLLQQVCSNAEVLHRKQPELSLGEVSVFNHVVSRIVYISFWVFHCSVACIKPETTYNDIDGAIKYGLDKLDCSEYFSFEITKAMIKPRDFRTGDQKLPAGMSRKSIERDLTKST